MSTIRVILLSLWTVFAITLSAIVALITFNPKISVGMARWFWSPVILWICGVKLKKTYLNNSFKTVNPSIIVANHSSFIDIAILFRTIPFNVHFVAKKELQKMPFVGWYVILTGMIFIDRSNRAKAYDSLKKAGKLIRKGKSIITFPEGTRSQNGEIKLFKQGSFQLALEAKVPIIPVRIKNAHNVWPANNLKIQPGEIEVIYGTPVNYETYKNMEAKIIAQKLQLEVEKLGN